MSILCFVHVEMTDVTSACHVCMGCKHSVISLSYSTKMKMYVLNLDCEVHVLNISSLSDTCTLLFPQWSGDSPLHYAADRGHLDTVKLLVLRGADLAHRNKVSVIVNW